MRRWRPSLALVLGGALIATLGLSLAGMVALRYLGPVTGFRNAAILLGAVIVAATAVLGWLLVRLLLRPIRALEAYAAQVHRAPAGPVPPPAHFGTRELHATARSVIEMAGTLRDREATIRSYTDHVTHELKSPVSVIRAAVELLEDGGTLSAADAALVAQIAGAGTQAEAQLEALRRAARARESRHVGQCRLADMAAGLAAAHPTLKLRISGETVSFPMAATGLDLVLGHLLANAAQHGARAVELAASDDGPVLEVRDDGPGISSGNGARVFDPFFTTRRGEGGTGMGLTIARNVLAAHGAALELLDAPRGAAFRLSFGAGDGP